MDILKKITTGALALTLAIGLGGAVLADDPSGTGDVTVDIQSSGVLAVSINNYGFGTHQYSLSQRTFPAAMEVTASDMRGTAGGWHVTIVGTDFQDTSDGSTVSFPISNFPMYGGWVFNSQPSGHATNTAPGVNTIPAISPAGISSNVMVAPPGSGAGHYKATYAASLTVPAGTLVGSYQSTLTVTISGDQP